MIGRRRGVAENDKRKKSRANWPGCVWGEGGEKKLVRVPRTSWGYSSAEAAAARTHALTRQPHLCATAFGEDRRRKGGRAWKKEDAAKGRRERTGTESRRGGGKGRRGRSKWSTSLEPGTKKRTPEKWGES